MEKKQKKEEQKNRICDLEFKIKNQINFSNKILSYWEKGGKGRFIVNVVQVRETSFSNLMTTSQ